ncbi:cytochrome P450 [Chytriomyces sp. MP71]|nr:cytochrome P450 [Chytriomyces sp. MP71]
MAGTGSRSPQHAACFANPRESRLRHIQLRAGSWRLWIGVFTRIQVGLWTQPVPEISIISKHFEGSASQQARLAYSPRCWCSGYPLLPSLLPFLQKRKKTMMWTISGGQIPAILVGMGSGEPFNNLLDWVRDYASDLGFITQTVLFNEIEICVTNSVMLRRVLVTHTNIYAKNPVSSGFFERFLGTGLLTAMGDVHKKQRTIMNPVFKVKHIHSLLPLFFQCANELKQNWMHALEDTKDITIDTLYEISRPAINAIGRAGFGFDFDACAMGGSTSDLYRAFYVFLEAFYVVNFVTLVFAPFLRFILPTQIKVRREQVWARRVIEEAGKEILESRKREVEEEKSGVGAAETGMEKSENLLTVMLRANLNEEEGKRLSDAEVQAQIGTFLVAGFETTSVAVTWTLEFLTLYPRVQEKLRAELREHMPTISSEPSAEYIHSSSTYLHAVVQESLRLMPPVPLVDRRTTQDDHVGGYTIPKGTNVIWSPYVIHRLKEFWGEDAEEYKPERWLAYKASDEIEEAGGAGSRPFGAFIPFGAGPRNCIGFRFAMLEAKAFLTVLVRTFEFHSVDTVPRPCSRRSMVTMKPSDKLELKLRRVIE